MPRCPQNPLSFLVGTIGIIAVLFSASGSYLLKQGWDAKKGSEFSAGLVLLSTCNFSLVGIFVTLLPVWFFVHRRLRELRRGKAIVWWKYDKRHWDQYVQDAWQAEKASLRRAALLYAATCVVAALVGVVVQVVVREQHPQLYWTWGTVSFAFVGSVIALKALLAYRSFRQSACELGEAVIAADCAYFHSLRFWSTPWARLTKVWLAPGAPGSGRSMRALEFEWVEFRHFRRTWSIPVHEEHFGQADRLLEYFAGGRTVPRTAPDAIRAAC